MKKTRLLSLVFTISSLTAITPMVCSCAPQTNDIKTNKTSTTTSFQSSKYCKVTFDKGEADEIVGTTVFNIRYGKKYATITKPKAIKKGHDFDKWVDKDGKEYQESDIIDSDLTLFPKFTKIETCSILFYTKVGHFENGQNYIFYSELLKNKSLAELEKTLPTPIFSSTWFQNNGFTIDGKEFTKDTKITSDLVVEANITPIASKDFLTCSWAEIGERCNALENNEISENDFCQLFTVNKTQINSMNEFVGLERTTLINNCNHKIRVVGTCADDETNYQVNYINNTSTKAALTFEFANVISDSNGYSISTLWNDFAYNKSTNPNANIDYLNSTLRKNLNGIGSASIQWFEKSGVSPSTTITSSVLEMLPEELQNCIKETTHKAVTTTSYTETSYSDKLFVPTTKELNATSKGVEATKPYLYYKDGTDSLRIKQQVRGADSALTGQTQITSGIKYTSKAYNWAGVHTGKGAQYWTSSANTSNGAGAWRVRNSDGAIWSVNVACYAFTVAPMFCI